MWFVHYLHKTAKCGIIIKKAVVNMDFGARLKELRNSKDLKQSELAEILGISTSAVGSYERCERQPTYELLHKYAQFFNVSIDYILCNSNEKLTVDAYQQLTTLDLSSFLKKHSITLDGVTLSDTDKQRVIDIAIVLCFDRLK